MNQGIEMKPILDDWLRKDMKKVVGTSFNVQISERFDTLKTKPGKLAEK